MTRIPASVDIATQWGVSRQTADRAVHELQRLGLVVRQRRWGTVVAPREAVKRTGRVALLVDQFSQELNFPSGDLIRGIQDVLGENINLLLTESKGDPDMEARQLRRLPGEVDGLIVYPTSRPKNTPVLKHLIESGMPVVVLDRIPVGVETDAVVSDNEAATLRAIRALEERGHRRIGFFSFHKPEFSSVKERHAAYQLALAEVGIEDATELTRWFARELESQPQPFLQSIHDAVFTLLNQPDPITALFCVQDSIAVAVLEACDRIGISVPDDLEIALFNDWPPVMLRSPWNLHRIVPRSYLIGQTAARLLKERIEGAPHPLQTVKVDADFFVANLGK